MPFSPKQRQGAKGADASLYVVATSMGVAQSELEKLLAGRASVGIAKKLAGSEQDGPAKVH
jgi:L-aminopeptidase/D-esterase-like protein